MLMVMNSARPASRLTHPTVYDIAIVGGGFSGVMTAVHLLRLCSTECSILLIERGDRLGRGLAYGTDTATHLLNVPAKGMSAFADEPSHFLSWVQKNKDAETAPYDFVSRQWYGEYIEGILNDQLARSSTASLHCVKAEVVAIQQNQHALCLTMRDSVPSYARTVVLAMGNFPPPDPVPMRDSSTRHYMRYAWSPEALDGIDDSDTILLIGSGLTAIDQVLTLESRGFRGTVHILSRRGLLPAVHVQEAPWPTEWTRELPGSLRPLVSHIRKQVRAAANQDVSWRPVIDSLRPVTQQLWKSMDLVERRRFLRHVRSLWEVHRHRVAPQIGQLISELQQCGRLKIEAGRILHCVDANGLAEVEYRHRDTRETRLLKVARIVNCTGHETDARKIDSQVVRSLLENRLGRVDASLQGLDVADDGAIIDAAGRPSKKLFALGPARKGLLWESTAVPEIRVQTQRLAEQLASQLASAAAMEPSRLGIA
jgi:uncharacterized NAD(P)/FAD-binding protein YdhS